MGALLFWALTLATALAVVQSWAAINVRLDRDLPALRDPCEHKWTRYAQYRLCLRCGDRTDDQKVTP